MNRKLLIFALLSLFGSITYGQVVADFYGIPTKLCTQPYEVSFYSLSQNDTSLLWNFGDGNTSTFFQPNHVYQNPGTYTVSLTAFGVGGQATATKTNYVEITATPTLPVVNMPGDTVNCGMGTQFTATGNDLLWFDDDDNLIHKGNTLNFPVVTMSGNYYVRSETESTPVKEGPMDPDSVGAGGYFNGNQGLEFDVLSDARIKSVLVDAGSAGQRTFTVEDTFGIPIETIDVFIPAGKSRVELNLELFPGSYVIRGVGVDLFRNNMGGANYPYNASGIVSITGATAGPAFYYFFYDWEVTTFCKSADVPIVVGSNDIAAPVITQDTFVANCGASTELIANSGDDVYWYDALGNEVGRGDTLNVGFAGGTSQYLARSVAQSGLLSVGPVNGAALGNGGYLTASGNAQLNFRVSAPMTLVSVAVDADSAGNRTIQIRNAAGLVASVTAMVPAGASRINLGVNLAPGEYSIGGGRLGFFQNDSVVVDYPYSIAGVVSITGSTTGTDTYNFFYDWEVTTACISDADTTVLEVLAPAPPVIVSPDSLAVPCEGAAQFIANGNVAWYNSANELVANDDTLSLTDITSATSYSAQVVEAGMPVFMDPVDPVSVGGGGYHGNGPGAFLLFDVLADIRLVSVWVDAGSGGVRDIELQDDMGNTLQTVSVNIPAGQGRVMLNLEIAPGSYRLGGSNMDLFRNNTGVPYPFNLPGQVSITGSSAGNSTNFYYYFYNWEVVSLCKSDPVDVKISVLPLTTPTVQADDTVCYLGQAIFQATSASAGWYDPNGTFLGIGQNFLTPPLTQSGTYTAIGESMEPTGNVGPADNSIGGGGYFNGDQGLEFTVLAPMRLNSAWVDAEDDGIRNFVLEDAGGNPLQTISMFIPAGQQRIGLGLDLQPGDYTLRADSTRLFRNNDGVSYPYTLAGLVSITSSTVGGGFYYFLYDWEVQDLPCTSDPVTFDVTVKSPLNASFTFSQSNHVLSFANSTPGAVSWSWDFGDGGTSTQQFPRHTYFAFGSFAVTLTVSDGECEGSFTDTVTIRAGVGVEELLAAGGMQLYPNPGHGQFVVEASALNTSDMAVSVFDFMGRKVYATSPIRTTAFKEEIDLSKLPAGTYWVRLQVNGAFAAKQYVKIF